MYVHMYVYQILHENVQICYIICQWVHVYINRHENVWDFSISKDVLLFTENGLDDKQTLVEKNRIKCFNLVNCILV